MSPYSWLIKISLRLWPICLVVLTWLWLVSPVWALTDAEKQAEILRLEGKKQELDKEISNLTNQLTSKQKESSSIQRDIDILDYKIKISQTNIKAKEVLIKQLAMDIGKKQNTIISLTNKLNQEQLSLAETLRRIRNYDDISLAEVALSQRAMTDLVADLGAFNGIQQSLHQTLSAVKHNKLTTENEKEKLESRHDQETSAKKAIEQEKRKIEILNKEKQNLLKINRQQEGVYKQVIAVRQQELNEILNALFRLRDSGEISFGQALDYAKYASGKTGVRAALILAILSQESDLGKNQGSCLITDISTGDGKGKNTGRIFEKVMAAPRDTTPFLAITSRLSLDWRTVAVSCPPSATWSSGRGYGGAMGPSQFIPSTWELVKKRLGSLLGIAPDSANPWNPQHSFVATGMYLADLGATSSAYADERNSACRYYSGQKCTPGRKPANEFYGDQVMAKAAYFQKQIETVNLLQNQ